MRESGKRSRRPCEICNGTKVCATCEGRQRVNLLMIEDNSREVIDCPMCGGSGECPACEPNWLEFATLPITPSA
jgi:hypothetical protein